MEHVLPDGGIAEEARDADQQFLEQQVDLLGVLPQIAHVLGHRGQAVDGHAAFDAAVQSAGFVEREVVARSAP